MENYALTIFSDSNGNAYIFWYGDSNNVPGLYAQKIDSQSRILWDPKGVLVRTQDFFESSIWLTDVTAISDGDGGAIVVWKTGVTYFSQRIDKYGETSWDNSQITNNAYGRVDCISDGAGGAILSWKYATGTRANVAMRINHEGKSVWENGQVDLGSDQYYTSLIPDGNHGAIVFGYNFPSHSMLHIDEFGNITWKLNNLSELFSATATADFSVMPDGAGGAILAYSKTANTIPMSVNISVYSYVSRLDESGNLTWTVQLGNAYYLSHPKITRSDNESFTFAWENSINGKEYFYLQKIDIRGKSSWAEGGVDIGRIYEPKRDFQIVSTSGGGTILVAEEGAVDAPLIYSVSVDKQGTTIQSSNTLYPSGAKRTYKDYDYPDPFSIIIIIALGFFIVILSIIIYILYRIITFIRKKLHKGGI